LLRRIVEAARLDGTRVAGLLQRDLPRPGRSKCDMTLEDVASGAVVTISVDRGADAEGCRLDVGLLAEATGIALRSLDGAPDLVIANKFGKVEAEGGGLRDLIVAALEAGARVVIAVPALNLEAWRAFAADLTTEIDVGSGASFEEACAALGVLPRAAAGAVTERV
jgi:nucleoside-triphosphatase THEP1